MGEIAVFWEEGERAGHKSVVGDFFQWLINPLANSSPSSQRPSMALLARPAVFFLSAQSRGQFSIYFRRQKAPKRRPIINWASPKQFSLAANPVLVAGNSFNKSFQFYVLVEANQH